jgi:hypothetical protein
MNEKRSKNIKTVPLNEIGIFAKLCKCVDNNAQNPTIFVSDKMSKRRKNAYMFNTMRLMMTKNMNV